MQEMFVNMALFAWMKKIIDEVKEVFQWWI